MGQKVNPIGFRLAVRRNWESRWYATKRDFPAFILEDYRIREFLKEKLRQAAVPRIFIERAGQKVRVRIWTARPGMVIGRKGDDLKLLRGEIQKVAGKARIEDIILEVNEVKRPDLVAQLVAENIALQLERRISFRRAMKKAVQTTMTNGADGILSASAVVSAAPRSPASSPPASVASRSTPSARTSTTASPKPAPWPARSASSAGSAPRTPSSKPSAPTL